VQHPDSDHESEVVESSLTSTSSLVESESEEGHDRHNGSVFDNDEATVIDAVTNQSTTASILTENHDSSEDVHTVDSVVSRGIGNLSLSRILKLTKARVIFAMISVTSALTILHVILQRRAASLIHRCEVMLRIIFRVQFRKHQKAIVELI